MEAGRLGVLGRRPSRGLDLEPIRARPRARLRRTLKRGDAPAKRNERCGVLSLRRTSFPLRPLRRAEALERDVGWFRDVHEGRDAREACCRSGAGGACCLREQVRTV